MNTLSSGMTVVADDRQGPPGNPGATGAPREGSSRSRAARQLANQVEKEAQRLLAMAEQLDRVLQQARLRQRQAWSFGSDGTA